MSCEIERMDSSLDYWFKPVDAGWVRGESMYDGTLSLHQLAEMNDILEVKEENERRIHAAAQR